MVVQGVCPLALDGCLSTVSVHWHWMAVCPWCQFTGIGWLSVQGVSSLALEGKSAWRCPVHLPTVWATRQTAGNVWVLWGDGLWAALYRLPWTHMFIKNDSVNWGSCMDINTSQHLTAHPESSLGTQSSLHGTFPLTGFHVALMDPAVVAYTWPQLRDAQGCFSFSTFFPCTVGKARVLRPTVHWGWTVSISCQRTICGSSGRSIKDDNSIKETGSRRDTPQNNIGYIWQAYRRYSILNSKYTIRYSILKEAFTLKSVIKQGQPYSI